jgi:multiple sugar transport system ATP-binding protein
MTMGDKIVAGFIGSPAMNFIQGRLRRAKGLVFAEEGGGIQASIQKKDEKRLRDYVGKEITLGLRPEDIRLAAVGSPRGARAKVMVEVVEPMGNQCVARLDARSEPTVGQPLELVLDLSKARF